MKVILSLIVGVPNFIFLSILGAELWRSVDTQLRNAAGYFFRHTWPRFWRLHLLPMLGLLSFVALIVALLWLLDVTHSTRIN